MKAQSVWGPECLLYCLVLCGVMSSASFAYPVKEVQSCLEDALRDRRFMRKTNKTLHLDYGDPAIEVFNILSAHNTMSIRALEQCVRNLMPEMFQDRSSVLTRNYTHGGSNITYLTGVFQATLPEISNKLVDCTAEPMRESQHYWMAPVQTLGVRAVYLESFANVRPKMSREERRKLRYAKYLEERNRTVWLGKPGPDVPFVEDEDEEEEEEYEYDEHADENLSPYLDRDVDSLYKIVVLLSDRSHFSGGEIYVSRQKRGDSRGDDKSADNGGYGEGEGEGEDAYEEEDEDVGQVADETIQGVLTRKKRASFPKYNARTAKIARYTPEKGGVLLLRTDFDHGMGTLQRGKRHALVLEFWPYADAAPGATRPTLKEAQPLPQRWREL